MNEFREAIELAAQQSNGNPVFDGVINETLYKTASLKILWILKEANDPENEAWDMRGAIRDLKTPSGIKKGWSNTFKKIVYVTNGLLNNLNWDENLFHPSYKPDVIDELQKVAFINVKKTGGGSSTNKTMLAKHYQGNKTLLFNQINEFEPELIIFGGTYWLFQNDAPANLSRFGICEAGIWGNRIIIDAFHPNARKKEEDYFNSIIEAVRTLRNRNS